MASEIISPSTISPDQRKEGLFSALRLSVLLVSFSFGILNFVNAGALAFSALVLGWVLKER